MHLVAVGAVLAVVGGVVVAVGAVLAREEHGEEAPGREEVVPLLLGGRLSRAIIVSVDSRRRLPALMRRLAVRPCIHRHDRRRRLHDGRFAGAAAASAASTTTISGDDARVATT